MSNHRLPHGEPPLPLRLVEFSQHICGVVLAGFLPHHGQVEVSPGLEGINKGFNVGLELGEGDSGLWQVYFFGAPGQSPNQRQEAATATHGLHDERPFAGRGAHPQHVDRVHHRVEGCVCSDRHHPAREIVVNARRNHRDRDVESGIASTFTFHQVDRRVGVVSPHHQESIHLVVLQLTRYRVEFGFRGNVAAGPEICSSGMSHALHIGPADIVEVALTQTRHPTAHRQHLVPEVNAGTHCDPRQLVHARSQRPGVHDRDPLTRGIHHRWPRLSDGPVDVDHHLEPGTTRRDGGLVVALSDVASDPAGRLHGGQQRLGSYLVIVHTDENRLSLGTCLEHLGNRLDAAGGCHPAVVR